MQNEPQYRFHTRHPASSSGLNSRQPPGTLGDFQVNGGDLWCRAITVILTQVK